MAAVDCAAGILRAVGRRRQGEGRSRCGCVVSSHNLEPSRRPDGEGLRARRRQTNLTTAIGKLGKEVLLPTQCTFSLLTLPSNQPLMANL